MGQRFVETLPAEYTTLQEIVLRKDGVKIPDTACNSHPVIARPPVEQLLEDQYPWLQDVQSTIEDNALQQWISWGAYHAIKLDIPSEPNTLSHPLPIFMESANNPRTLYHCMNVIRTATEFLNPGQTPVIAVDQPLYIICKLLQWNFPDTHGEDKFVILLGGLHIEKMLFQMIGDWMDGSGWTTALSNGDVATTGTAQSFIGVSHITKTRYVHEVTAASLYILASRAYADYIQSTEDSPPLNRQQWIERQVQAQPQARYWHETLKLELLVLQVQYSVLLHMNDYVPRIFIANCYLLKYPKHQPVLQQIMFFFSQCSCMTILPT